MSVPTTDWHRLAGILPIRQCKARVFVVPKGAHDADRHAPRRDRVGGGPGRRTGDAPVPEWRARRSRGDLGGAHRASRRPDQPRGARGRRARLVLFDGARARARSAQAASRAAYGRRHRDPRGGRRGPDGHLQRTRRPRPRHRPTGGPIRRRGHRGRKALPDLAPVRGRESQRPLAARDTRCSRRCCPTGSRRPSGSR